MSSGIPPNPIFCVTRMIREAHEQGGILLCRDIGLLTLRYVREEPGEKCGLTYLARFASSTPTSFSIETMDRQLTWRRTIHQQYITTGEGCVELPCAQSR